MLFTIAWNVMTWSVETLECRLSCAYSVVTVSGRTGVGSDKLVKSYFAVVHGEKYVSGSLNAVEISCPALYDIGVKELVVLGAGVVDGPVLKLLGVVCNSGVVRGNVVVLGNENVSYSSSAVNCCVERLDSIAVCLSAWEMRHILHSRSKLRCPEQQVYLP